MHKIKNTLVWYTEITDSDFPDFDAETIEEVAENQVKWVNDGTINVLDEVAAAGDDLIYTAEVDYEDSDD